jgi:hypothetical protein
LLEGRPQRRGRGLAEDAGRQLDLDLVTLADVAGVAAR